MASRLPCRPGPCPCPINRRRKRCRPSSLAALASTISTTPVPSGAATTCTTAHLGHNYIFFVMSVHGLIKSATNTDADSVLPVRLHMAVFPLAAPMQHCLHQEYMKLISRARLVHASWIATSVK